MKDAGVRTAAIGSGAVDLFVNRDKLSYRLEITAAGPRLPEIVSGTTRLSPSEVQARYAGKGFGCRTDTKVGVVRCERRERDIAYVVNAVDPCLTPASNRSFCAGRGVTTFTASVGFANGLPERAFIPVYTYLVEAVEFGLGGWEPRTRTWVEAGLSDAKVHRGDFQGAHLELEPGTGASSGYPNVYSVVVRGTDVTS